VAEDRNSQGVIRMLDAFNTGNEALVDELVDPDYHEHRQLPGAGDGRDRLKQKIRRMRAAFPDARFEIEDMRGDGDRVTFDWKMTGTQDGTFMGYAPTGRSITHFGTDVVTFRDGRMVHHRSGNDPRKLLDALGLPPHPAQS
jgi:steroid delta-isomerase-like uncharacterized protein